MNYSNIVTLVIYLVILLVIAFIANKRSKTQEDYLLGNRSLNPLTAAISAGAADMSGWLLLGLPGAIYAYGLNQVWIAVGLIIGAYFNWKLTAKKLRVKSQELNAITIPDFISKNVDCNDKSIRIIGALMILIFFTLYVASGFVAGAKVFSDYFAINYSVGLFLTFLAVVFTTFIGGFLAVSWSELFQGVIMLMVIMVVPILAFHDFSSVDYSLKEAILMKDTNMLNIFHNTTVISILSLLAWGLGYFGQPHILVKFMAIKDKKMVKATRVIAMSWMALGLFFAVLVGLLGAAFFLQNPLKDAELVMVNLTSLLFGHYFMGIVIIAILSAVFSTANAQILVVSSIFTNDLKILKNSITINRVIVLFVGIVALIIAFDSDSKVLSMVSYAWAGFGACFGPIMILSLNSKKKICKQAALTGIIVGGISVILWNTLGKFFPSVEFLKIYVLLPAFLLSLGSILITNYFLIGRKAIA